MKKRLVTLVCVLGLSLLCSGSALALQLDIAGLAKTDIFYSTLSFTTYPGFNFLINGSDGVGDSFGLYGQITNPSGGSYTIGPVQTNIDGDQFATVSGTGQIIIHDGVGNDFTASVDWKSIYQAGTGNTLNVEGAVNLNSFSYAGAVNDLLTFAAAPAGIGTVTFQYIPELKLSDATTNGLHNLASFSGVMATVPLPSTMLLLGSGVVGLGLLRYRRRNRA